MKFAKQLFRGDLTEQDLSIIEDALEMYQAFKVYGDGREQHQKQVDTVIKKLYKTFYEVQK